MVGSHSEGHVVGCPDTLWWMEAGKTKMEILWKREKAGGDPSWPSSFNCFNGFLVKYILNLIYSAFVRLCACVCVWFHYISSPGREGTDLRVVH